MSATDRALAHSRYAHLGNSHTPSAPRLKLALLTCMDARIDVFKLFGLQPGDAHVVRNAGGRATEDAVRSLEVSQARLGTEEVMVVHHTDCAAGFDDDEAAVREDVAALRASPSLPHRGQVRGFIYDIARGAVIEVT